jgi:Bacterial protein of unknown function (DUF937)
LKFISGAFLFNFDTELKKINMLEQLTQLVQQFGQEHVVKNTEVANEHNESVMNEASETIQNSLKQIASHEGGAEVLGNLFQGENANDESNPVVKTITDQLVNNLGSKFGMSQETASDVAGSMIPKILGSLVGGAKDPNNAGFNISDIIGGITNGGNSGGIMDAISKYGGQFGLDKNQDGNVDLQDAISMVTGNSGGVGSILSKIFSK